MKPSPLEKRPAELQTEDREKFKKAKLGDSEEGEGDGEERSQVAYGSTSRLFARPDTSAKGGASRSVYGGLRLPGSG